MRLLALESAGPRCSVALLEHGALLAHRAVEAARGHAAVLPVLVQELLAGAAPQSLARGLPPEAVAVGVGPGGFTGLRAGLALASGLAAGWGVPLLGASTGDALAAVTPVPEGWVLWAATDNKRGRLFLERPGEAPVALEELALPAPAGPVVLVGDAAPRAAARLLARGHRVMLGRARHADALGVGLAAPAAARAAVPLYVDAPATT
jgi:tRNA threonylcarbamoyladenosine biosynthesis protein TsaB